MQRQSLEDQGKAEEVLEPDHKECGIPSHDKIRTPHISTCISLPISWTPTSGGILPQRASTCHFFLGRSVPKPVCLQETQKYLALLIFAPCWVVGSALNQWLMGKEEECSNSCASWLRELYETSYTLLSPGFIYKDKLEFPSRASSLTVYSNLASLPSKSYFLTALPGNISLSLDFTWFFCFRVYF
jgi:hypothetical protein